MMTKNLLALSWALQTVTVDSDTQRYLLPALGNKLEALLGKNTPNEEDWQVVRTKMETIFQQNPTLAQRYQQLQMQLQTWTVTELRALLPTPESIQPFQVASVQTLGYLPAELHLERTLEIENIVVKITTSILKSEKVTETANTLLPDAKQLTKLRSQ